MAPITLGSLIVVTGITGYIGSHVGLAALQAGYRVRGTVRNTKKAEELRAKYNEMGVDAGKDKLEIVIVDDLMSQEQYEKAFVGAEGIAHVALPQHTATWVEDVNKSVLGVLKAAAKESSIKRVVLTSSSSTVMQGPDFVDRPLTDQDWNENALVRYEKMGVEDRGKPESIKIVYAVAKMNSEKEAWKWMEDNKPKFEFATIIPVANFGPVLYGEPSSTATWITTLLKNDDKDAKAVTSRGKWFVDVRDDGRLHVLALDQPEAAGKRIWAAAGPFGWNLLLSILRKHFPKVAVPEDQKEWTLSDQKIDSEVGRKLLGGWISLEDSVVDTAKSAGY